MKVGDRVRYSGDWLRNTGQIVGPVPFMRGEVLALQEFEGRTPTIATVEFNWLIAHGPDAHIRPPERIKVLTCNLEVVG